MVSERECLHGFEDWGQMGGRVPRRTQRPRVRPGEAWTPSGYTLPLSHHDENQQHEVTLDGSGFGWVHVGFTFCGPDTGYITAKH